MKCPRLFLGFMLWVMVLPAFAAADPVSVRLLSSVDVYCDGQGVTMGTSAVMPGSCIQYRLVVSNTGDLPVVGTRVAAFVPRHTQLYEPLRIITGRSLVSEATIDAMQGTEALGMRLGQMQPGTVTLKYAVRVDL